ncbi:transposase family protein [Luteibacter aegosomatis]|uniref:transposase family protein n=1 Tax=Luteibacter aegosomatis TaxID=2911537 RepID=UPI001FF9CC6B|nr:transposase family protein [Luteibacter aegosomatis]UPG86997.1 transposase family protein [Luteibacter aegosomatis]
MADGARASTGDGIDIQRIAFALRVTKRAAELKAAREAWPFSEVAVRGGRKRLYQIDVLPDDVQRAVRHANAVTAAQAATTSVHFRAGESLGRRHTLTAAIDQTSRHRAMEAGLAAAAGKTGHGADRMNAKLDLLVQLDSFAANHGMGITAAIEAFCGAYASGEVGSETARRVIGPEVSGASLRRWRKALQTKGAVALAGAYGNREGSGLINGNPQLYEFAVGMISTTPHLGGKHLHRAIEARFAHMGDSLPTLRSVQRWLTHWKAENHQVFTALTNPDAWKNKYMLAMGNASEDVSRLNERWEFDSTPGDIELIDGRHNLVGIIDVWSRRATLRVTKTSSADAVCQTLRSALMQWGVPERAKLDNGQDYVSHRMQRVFASLGVDVKLSAPFSPWEKPHIERFFHTFSHDLLEMLPGFSGHNVAEAQALRAGKSFAERLFKKNSTVQLRMTAAELQAFCDKWLADVYMQEAREGLAGMSVFERVASSKTEVRRIRDVRALDVLMAEAPGGTGARTVAKKGLRIEGMYYGAPELGALVGEKVHVLYDEADQGRVVVYHDEAFVCIAECPELLGISRREVAIEAKARQAKLINEKRNELRAIGRKAKTRDIAMEILDAKAAQASMLTMLPQHGVIHMTPALDAAALAAAALDAADLPHDRRPIAQADIDLVHRMNRDEQQQNETEEDRFRRAIRLLAEPDIDQVNARWLKSYQNTSEFGGRWTVFEDFGGAPFGLGTDYDHLCLKTKSQGDY